MLYSNSSRAFYENEWVDQGLYQNLPDDLIEIDADTYRALMEAQSAGKEFQVTTEGQALIRDRVFSLDEAHSAAEKTIDAAATRARLRYISPNKDATYQEKARELDRWIAAGRPATCDPGSFPYIEAESLYTGLPLTEVAESIETARNQWAQLDPVIEGIARGGKVLAFSKTTADEVITVRDACVAQLDQL